MTEVGEQETQPQLLEADCSILASSGLLTESPLHNPLCRRTHATWGAKHDSRCVTHYTGHMTDDTWHMTNDG